jgi:hypothetical protein
MKINGRNEGEGRDGSRECLKNSGSGGEGEFLSCGHVVTSHISHSQRPSIHVLRATWNAEAHWASYIDRRYRFWVAGQKPLLQHSDSPVAQSDEYWADSLEG